MNTNRRFELFQTPNVIFINSNNPKGTTIIVALGMSEVVIGDMMVCFVDIKGRMNFSPI